MDCPRCGLISPSNALRCDCGYNFSKPETEQVDIPKGPVGLLGWLIVPGLLLAMWAVVGAYYAWQFGASAWQSGATIGDLLNASLWVLYIAAAVGLGYGSSGGGVGCRSPSSPC